MKFVDNHNVICIDWNGVLDTYVGYANGQVYPPRDGVKEFLQKLIDDGYRIIIMTSAPVNKVLQWLHDYDMYDLVEEVTNKKVPAIIYIDDRAIQFNGNFAETLVAIQNFRVHWIGDIHT